MILRPLTNGLVSGSDVVECPSGILGGVNIRTDASNNATVTIRKNTSTGDIIYQQVTVVAQFPVAPIQGASVLHYEITGTNASAQLYEWVE